MGELIHENRLRSHESFSIEGLEPFIEKVMGEDWMSNVVENLKEIILSRVPEDNEIKREFKSRFVLSCYCVYSVVKEREKPKKVSKKNGKKEKVNTGSKEELPKSLEVKEDRVTSQNLTTD